METTWILRERKIARTRSKIPKQKASCTVPNTEYRREFLYSGLEGQIYSGNLSKPWAQTTGLSPQGP